MHTEKISCLFRHSGFFLSIEMIAAQGTLGLMASSIAIGGLLPGESGPDLPSCVNSCQPPEPDFVNVPANCLLPCVPELGGGAQDFLEFLEGLETPKGIPFLSEERKRELEREMEEEWEAMFEKTP